MIKLYIYPKEAKAFQFPLPDKKISIGRISKNDIPLKDPYCSGCHAYVYPVEEGYAIRDVSSKNGIFVNGRQIHGETALKRGDEILIGTTTIFYNKESASNVDVTDAPSPSGNIKTVMSLHEVLKKHDISTTIQAAAVTGDIQQVKLQHPSLGIINEVSKALSLHLPLQELLEHIMDLIITYLPMDRGVLMRKRGNPVQFKSDVVRINSKRLRG